jgi:hypothetical protein
MIIRDNPLMKNVRGTLGRTVYCRQMYGQTVMCNMPRKPDKSKATAAQRATRFSFQEASRYAKAVIQDPERKAYYQRKARQFKLPNAYTAALTDYMRKGQVESVNRRKYTGKVGGEIKIVVRKKDFPARAVEICLSTIDGAPVEKGLATRDKDGNWTYRNTVAVQDAETVVLAVRVI